MEETQMTPAQKYAVVLEKCVTEATRALPTSIPEDHLHRAHDRLMVAMKQAAMGNTSIYRCSPSSVARAVVMSALTDLYPGGPMPDVYVLPRGTELQWEISYRGMMKLAQRAGVRVRAVAVMKGDQFSVERGLREDLVHRPKTEPTWEDLTHVYVVAYQGLTPLGFEVLTRLQIEKRRAASKSKNGPWRSWPLEMALKTGIRHAILRGLVPLDETASQAFQVDLTETVTLDPIDAPENQARASGGGMEMLEAALIPETPEGSSDV